ncbi:unnamed protein product [Thlaspi arvense]|uniref:H(+)-transporting two-sector ATPase n=1 Tax=Thlaspi arvense TaxID=13288 RepID=A0AAU9RVN0_THLAR|nr:unnamed protein product [Thlaspi arvense]
MPNIYNALVVKGQDTLGEEINVTCEVQQLLGNNRVRDVAMSATEGLKRGMDVVDMGNPLSVPVGGATLGRIFDVLGEPVDNLGNNEITILVNDAEKNSDIDPQEAQQTLEIAEANLRKAEGKRQTIEANLALRRARTRVEALNTI